MNSHNLLTNYDEEIDDDNDDWSAVPAFLRRGGKK